MSIFNKSKNKKTEQIAGSREKAALPPAPASIVSDGTKISGDITSGDQLQVDGELEGTLHVTSHVVVGKTGKLSANLEVQSLQVFGKVIGDVISEERVSIERSGAIEGNITAPKLAISEGALFKGNIDMSQRFKRNADKSPENKKGDKADKDKK